MDIKLQNVLIKGHKHQVMDKVNGHLFEEIFLMQMEAFHNPFFSFFGINVFVKCIQNIGNLF